MYCYKCNICGGDNVFEAGPEINNIFDKCIYCGSSEKNRLLKFLLDFYKVQLCFNSPVVLNYKPQADPYLFSYISEFKPLAHVYIDDSSHGADHRYNCSNIINANYADNTFDLIIVNNLDKSQKFIGVLGECFRILKSGGACIVIGAYGGFHPISDCEDGKGNTGRQTIGELKYCTNARYKITFPNELEIAVSPDIQYNHDQMRLHGISCNQFFFSFKKTNNVFQVKDTNILNNRNILVSICCITYNHIQFIERAVNGFLMQLVNFNVEIVIADDCSTDGTLLIIKKYADKYPGLFRILESSKNIGMHANFTRAIQQCTGKYIAYCEGDDYWIDNTKLIKQYLSLENDPSVVISYTGVQAHTNGVIDYSYVGGVNYDLSADQLLLVPPINTLTVMFRNILTSIPPEIYTSGPCDLFIWSLLGNYGGGKFLTNVLPSIYNMHEAGVHSVNSRVSKNIMHLMAVYSLYLYYKRTLMAEIADRFMVLTDQIVEAIIVQFGDSSYSLLTTLPDRLKSMADGHYDCNTDILIQTINHRLVKC